MTSPMLKRFQSWLAGSNQQDDSLGRDWLEKLDPDRLPRHVAIIMDGNGRWAEAKRLPRRVGHLEGVDALRQVVETGVRLGLEVLTVYAFSTENWGRPIGEVDFLMKLVADVVRRDLPSFHENGIRFQVIGRVDTLPQDVRAQVEEAARYTAGNDGLLLNVAFNYGGRAEIVDAAKRLCREATEGLIRPDDIDENLFSSRLYTAGIADPDLVIRTGGEYRVSNFLLWQLAYAEIWVTPVLWPGFTRGHFLQAIVDFQRRERRYGKLRRHPSRESGS